MTKKKQNAPQALKDEMLVQATAGSDYVLWRKNLGGTVAPAADTGGGPHVKVFDGRSE